MLSREAQAAIEKTWFGRAREQELKTGTMKYRRAEIEFFTGAMAAINAIYPNEEPGRMSKEVPVSWYLNIISGRPVMEDINE